MNCIEAILSRRSIRCFRAEPIPAETVELLLRAGMAAPSAMNLQPWEFIIVTDRVRLTAMAEIIPYGKMLPQAALAVFICGNMRRAPEQRRELMYWVLDCSAAAQNILLAAHGLNLGGVWLGVFPRQERMRGLAELFRLPSHIQPHSVLALGVPDETGAVKEKFDPNKIHEEEWTGGCPDHT
ncbi:MAG: nitroreductase family protein [Acidobacteria bacterium]|nr:nitroreductase family protein [Acidobacteriota bacterium]